MICSCGLLKWTNYIQAAMLLFFWVSEPDLCPAESHRAAGTAPGGEPPNHQSHKGLCAGAHRHRSRVAQWPAAIQERQWLLGPAFWWSPHLPRRQTPRLPVCSRQPWSNGLTGEYVCVVWSDVPSFHNSFTCPQCYISYYYSEFILLINIRLVFRMSLFVCYLRC